MKQSCVALVNFSLQSLEHYNHYKNMQFLKVKIVIKQTNKQTIPITVFKVNVKKRHNEALTSYKRVRKDTPAGSEIIIY